MGKSTSRKRTKTSSKKSVASPIIDKKDVVPPTSPAASMASTVSVSSMVRNIYF